ncbi:MAG: hypothetical protein ABJB95_04020, partial [Gemmatimonadales bacterium]
YAAGAPLAITSESENAWRVNTRDGEATIHYRIQLPYEDPTNRASWRSALRSDGGSVNATDTFMYLRDFTRAPIEELTLDVPDSWRIATALTRSTTGTYSAPTTTSFLDSPILLGDLRTWSFSVNGISHHIAYWPLPNATPFDTAQFVGSVERFARESFGVFRKAPYREYTFLFQDGAWGGLEHASSVTIGTPSTALASDPRALMDEIAHEFFHTWNLMALNPRGVSSVSADPPAHTRELWWSEGVTVYYAETLMRRAGFPERGRARDQELADWLSIYRGSFGNTVISPEQGSWASVDPPDPTNDYLSNYYVQGRLIAYALDLMIRDSTGGRRSLDDVMRAMYDRFAKKSAFSGHDIENTVASVCGCNVHGFFEDHVRKAGPIDFNQYLRSAGLRVVYDTIPSADSAGVRFPDLRISVYTPSQGGRMRVRIMDPRTVWRNAGLHTGMELVALNGIRVDSFPDFRRAIRSVKLGTVVPVDVIAGGSPRRVNVSVSGFDRVKARILDAPNVTPARLERRRIWMEGTPSA